MIVKYSGFYLLFCVNCGWVFVDKLAYPKDGICVRCFNKFMECCECETDLTYVDACDL